MSDSSSPVSSAYSRVNTLAMSPAACARGGARTVSSSPSESYRLRTR